MNNVSFNREQFNDTIIKRLFYSILDRLIPSKRVNYPSAKEKGYQKAKKVNYPSAKNVI